MATIDVGTLKHPLARRLRLPRVSLLIAIALSPLLVYAAVRAAGSGALHDAFDRITGEPVLVLAFVAAYTCAFWLRSIAWTRLLRGGVSTPAAFSILQTALCLNHLLPVKAGDVARPYLAARRGVPAAGAVSTTVAARLIDFTCLLMLAAFFLPLAAGFSALATLAVPAAIITCSLAAIAVLKGSAIANALPGAIGSLAAKARESLNAMRSRDIAAGFAWTAPSWALEGVATFAVFRAAGADIGIETALAATAATLLFQVFHFTPGGLGVYEASMAATLNLCGVPVTEALALSITAHAVKFAYSFTFGAAFAGYEASRLLRERAERSSTRASRFEIVAARCWNLVNEGKPFTVIFALTLCAIVTLTRPLTTAALLHSLAALVALVPLFAVFYRFDFPLRLRIALWAYLLAFLVLFQQLDVLAIVLTLGLYVTFTVFIWGSVYYHLRIGIPLTNFTRFWRLVLENPDTTSGNFLEQAPKCLLLVLAFTYLASGAGATPFLAYGGFLIAVAVSAVLVHQWFFTWTPAMPPTPSRPASVPARKAKRVIAIVIDGCRADRLREAHTPFIDRLRRQGTEFTDMRTVYPARTVTCFSSMLSGAPPAVHGMRSNFVHSLGLKCDSLFSSLPRARLRARLVGIAHLIDAFGEENVVTVSARTHNDEVDAMLVEQAQRVLREDDPDLLVLQLISVDQTGHARGSYNAEYLQKIEESDRHIEAFIRWCDAERYLEDTTVLITADHGQGIGIGGHGHLTPTEIKVPCIFWGAGVEAATTVGEPRSIMDIAPTLASLLGTAPPEHSAGQPLFEGDTLTAARPLVHPTAVPVSRAAGYGKTTLEELRTMQS